MDCSSGEVPPFCILCRFNIYRHRPTLFNTKNKKNDEADAWTENGLTNPDSLLRSLFLSVMDDTLMSRQAMLLDPGMKQPAIISNSTSAFREL